MIGTLIATIALSAGIADKPLSCPIMGGGANLKGAYSDYNGVRVYYCCGGCDTKFEADPAKLSAEATKKGMVWGVFLFDPVSGNRIKPEKAIKETSDFNGVRFTFENAGNKAKFDADPKRFGNLPQMEALFCPVMKQKVANYGKSSGYVDFKDVRYYMCCAGCEVKFQQSPDSYVKVQSDGSHPMKPGIATQPPEKGGK